MLERDREDRLADRKTEENVITKERIKERKRGGEIEESDIIVVCLATGQP